MTNFIWDVDGTLIDSYPMMLNSLIFVCKELNYKIKENEILFFIKNKSISEFLFYLSKQTGLNINTINEIYNKNSNSEFHNKLIVNVKLILNYLKDKKVNNYIYTHKKKVTYDILNNLNILSYFIEIVTYENGFKRKPDPEGINYLINKYDMNKSDTYYVGDRNIDVDAAENAGIKSILLLADDIVEAKGNETYIVNDLSEIKGII